jgi:hypothetical protein
MRTPWTRMYMRHTAWEAATYRSDSATVRSRDGLWRGRCRPADGPQAGVARPAPADTSADDGVRHAVPLVLARRALLTSRSGYGPPAAATAVPDRTVLPGATDQYDLSNRRQEATAWS